MLSSFHCLICSLFMLSLDFTISISGLPFVFNSSLFVYLFFVNGSLSRFIGQFIHSPLSVSCFAKYNLFHWSCLKCLRFLIGGIIVFLCLPVDYIIKLVSLSLSCKRFALRLTSTTYILTHGKERQFGSI